MKLTKGKCSYQQENSHLEECMNMISSINCQRTIVIKATVVQRIYQQLSLILSMMRTLKTLISFSVRRQRKIFGIYIKVTEDLRILILNMMKSEIQDLLT